MWIPRFFRRFTAPSLRAFAPNIGGTGDYDALLEWAKRTRPAVLLIMNNPAQAVRFARALPQTRIVMRFWHSLEGTFWQVMTPEDALQYIQAGIKGLDLPDNLYIDVNNEPSHDAEFPLVDLLDWERAMIRTLSAAGLKYCTAFASAKTIDHIDVHEHGIWDAFLKTVHEYRDDVIVGVHEYAFGYVAVQLYGLQTLVNPPVPPWNVPDFSKDPQVRNYYLFRFIELAIRARELGYHDIWFAITECFIDYMGDVDRAWKYNDMGIGQWLKQWTGSNMRGTSGIEEYCRRVFPGYSPQDIHNASREWLAEHMPGCLLGWCQFTWSNHGHWVDFWLRWADLNHMETLPTYNPEERAATWWGEKDYPVEYVRKQITVTASPNLRVRQGPGLSYDIIGVLEEGYIAQHNISKEPVPKDGYEWVQIEGVGWVASEFLQIEEIPQDEPEPDGCLPEFMKAIGG